jgi:hypothetical protein
VDPVALVVTVGVAEMGGADEHATIVPAPPGAARGARGCDA